MSRSANGNFTASGTDFEVANAGSDPIRKEDLQKLAAALRDHAHEATRGLAIKRVQSGTFAARPAAGNAGHVYVATDTGVMCFDTGAAWTTLSPSGITTSQIATGGQINKCQLDYAEATDRYSGAAMPAGNTFDLITAQSFTVDDANSEVEVQVNLGVLFQDTSGVVGRIHAQVVVDALAAKRLSSAVHAASGYVMAGGGHVRFSGLAAGAHTVKVQLRNQQAGTLYLRCAAETPYEFCLVKVYERKR